MSTTLKRIFNMVAVLLIAALVAGFLMVSPTEAKSKAPKYIIVMISDGWGYNHINATSYYVNGKADGQPYTKFPFQFAMSTYEVEKSETECNPLEGGYIPSLAWGDFYYVQYPCSTDSASAATVMSTGVKTYNGYIGMDTNGVPQWHVMQEAETKGKATGVITSVEFSHATPAGFVAHNINRNNYADIANEMIYDSATDVIMGAGAPDYDNSGNPQNPNGKEKYVGGPGTWLDITDNYLVTGADADGDGDTDDWTVIRSRADFLSMANGRTPSRVLGIPYVYTTLQQSRSGDAYADPFEVSLTETVPTLEEMTKAALNVLDNDPDGFILMIEGGAVDWAAHGGQSGRLIEEQIDFDNSVTVVMDWVKKNSNWGETLLIVTGDHETGYLTGLMDTSNPVWTPVTNNGAGNLPGMQWNIPQGLNYYEHTNQLIPFYAKGDDGRWFTKRAILTDPMRGPYIANTDIANVILQTLDGR